MTTMAPSPTGDSPSGANALILRNRTSSPCPLSTTTTTTMLSPPLRRSSASAQGPLRRIYLRTQPTINTDLSTPNLPRRKQHRRQPAHPQRRRYPLCLMSHPRKTRKTHTSSHTTFPPSASLNAPRFGFMAPLLSSFFFARV